MLKKLKSIYNRYQEIAKQISEPDVMSDMQRYIKLNKDYKDLTPIIDDYNAYAKILDDINSAKEMLSVEKDEEFKNFAKQEIEQLNSMKIKLEEHIKLLLLPKDPQDSKNAIMEIRAGTGGDEASIFAGDLFRMYSKFCEIKKWNLDLVSLSEGTKGGFKEIIFNVTGDNVYGQLKYESGVHRVQRVPQTETQGRIHTSAATVAVFPEADEFDVVLKTEDIRKDTFCSSGPGGQSVNTTYSAIRLTHIPSGIVVICQDEKSQIKNYEKALKVLRSRLYDLQHQKYLDEISSKRKSMVSTGDRSAKIRTYNYPQSRITDHRIGLTLYNLSVVLDGNIQEIINALQLAENTERLNEAVAE